VAPELARRGHEVTVVGGDPLRMAPVLDPVGVAHLPARTTADVVWATRTATRGGRPDLVHTHMTAAELAGVVTLPLVRRRLVTTRHFPAPRGRDRSSRRVWGVLPHLMAAEIAISQFVADHAGSDCVVIPNGVPDRPFPTTRRGPVVLVAQRLLPEKDTGTVIQAWARAGLADRGWRLEVAGEGRELRYLVDLVARLRIEPSVTFLGVVDDLDRRMAEASVLVASTPAEGFGLTVVEAMAAGLPVVAAGGGAHPEVLGPLGPELLFTPRDVGDLARVLTEVVDTVTGDPAAGAELGRRLRARYEAEYTVERHVDRLEELYARIVG